MAQKDVATLNKIIADDLIYTHSLGASGYKKTLIRGEGGGGNGLHIRGASKWCGRISAMPWADRGCGDQLNSGGSPKLVSGPLRDSTQPRRAVADGNRAEHKAGVNASFWIA